MTGALVLTGERLTPVPDAVVVFDDRIRAVGPAADVTVPDGATVLHRPGHCLLPGVIDAHVHTRLHPPRRMLAGGLTTVRDLGWQPDVILADARRSRRDGVDGPTILAAGPILTAPDGYPVHAHWHGASITALPLASAAHAVEIVEWLVAEGASVIKVALDQRRGPTSTPDVVAAVVETAHRLDRRVTAHIAGVPELEKALDAGVDELAHMLMSPDPIPDPLLDRMVAAGVGVVTTLMFREPHDYDVAVANTRRFHEKGGTVIYGTDIGNSGATPHRTGPVPGIEPREFIALLDAGLTASEALRAATADAARWLGLDHVGVLAPGKDADLVLVRGDPLADIKQIGNVQQVWRRGLAVL